MKYALFLFLFFTICSSAKLFAQSDIDEDGSYYSSGTVYNGDQLTGYFTLQVGRVDDEILKYTIKLLDRNADQIGKTVYQRKNEFDIQRVTYNGTYLALQLKEGENPAYIDLLNGAGERMARKTFDDLDKARITNLWPVEEGFIFAISYKVNPVGKKTQRRWKIGLLSNEDGEVKWEIESENPPKTRHYVDLLDADKEMLLFSKNELDYTRSKPKGKAGLLAVEIKSGKILFEFKLPDDDDWKSRTFLAANITGNGFVALQYYDLYDDRKYTISNFNRSGRRTSKHQLSLKDEMHNIHSEKERRTLPNSYWIENGQLFTADGRIQLAVQNFRNGFTVDVSRPQSILIDTLGQLIAKEVADTKEFRIKAKYLGAYVTLGSKTKGIIRDVKFHGGPFPFAGQQRTDDLTIQYFFDREFTKEGVKYESIHAIYYLDGELIEEVIPFESDADMVRIYPGKEGYFMIMEAYSNGSIKTRLERMDF